MINEHKMEDDFKICVNCKGERHKIRVIKKITEYSCDNCDPKKFSTLVAEFYDPEFAKAVTDFCHED